MSAYLREASPATLLLPSSVPYDQNAAGMAPALYLGPGVDLAALRSPHLDALTKTSSERDSVHWLDSLLAPEPPNMGQGLSQAFSQGEAMRQGISDSFCQGLHTRAEQVLSPAPLQVDMAWPEINH